MRRGNGSRQSPCVLFHCRLAAGGSITIDDFNIYDTPTLSGAARNQAILAALDKRKLKAAAFVAGKFVDKPELLPLLRLWNDGGHLIGNHTYSHGYYPNIDFAKYTEDILRNEALLQGFKRYRKFLRFPYLKEGKTAEQRDRMRAFLSEHGYRNGHVTIDASDWYIDGRLRQRLKNSPQADLNPYREFYLKPSLGARLVLRWLSAQGHRAKRQTHLAPAP